MNPVDRIATVSQRFEGASHLASTLHELSALLRPDLLDLETRLSLPPSPGSRCTRAAGDLIRAGGKRIRPALCLLSFRLASGAESCPQPVLELACCIEWLHTATLLHDDVIDDASERRSMPCARRVWGNAVSVIAGDLLLVHAMQRLHAIGNPALDALLDRTLRELIEGEVNQLEQRGRAACDRDGFELIATQKTGSLFALACAGGACLGGIRSDQLGAWCELAVATGLAFQLSDDLLDLCSSPEVLGKGIGQDLANGSLTLPVADVLARHPLLRRELEQHICGSGASIPVPLATRILQAARHSDTLDRCRTLVVDYTGRALQACALLRCCPERELLERFIRWLAERSTMLRADALDACLAQEATHAG